jgi:hypothetical protein
VAFPAAGGVTVEAEIRKDQFGNYYFAGFRPAK